MSRTRCTSHPSSAGAAARNAVAHRRVLTRPEIGAVAAAIAIFIFFFAVAAPFRTLPRSQRSSTRARRSASSRSAWPCS